MQTLAIVGGIFIVAMFGMSILAAKVAQTTFWRGVAIWLSQGFAAGVIIAGLIYGIKPYLLDAFVVPTNSMAPTIVGYHSEAPCPFCAEPTAILTRPEPGSNAPDEPGERPSTCPKCGRFGKAGEKSQPVLGPDRILVNKLMKPERWDIIVFRYPVDPQLNYVDRVVGMPGETVSIDEKDLWIDGTKTPLPESVGKWTYTTKLDNGESIKFATKDNPLKLGPNEYCVLGDFSAIASDSRIWGPVPKENVVGVVSVRYWPVSRWGVLK